MVSILDAIGSGLNFLSGREANKANVSANQANNAATLALQKQLLNTTTPFTQTTSSPGAGTVTSLAPERTGALSDAFDTESVEGATNLQNAIARNVAFQSFSPAVADLPAARGIVQSDRDLQQAEFDKGRTDIVSALARTKGGTSNFEPATTDAIARFTNSLRLGNETDAINLFQGSLSNDIGNLTNLNAALTAGQQGPKIPGFTGETGQGAAANAVNAAGRINIQPNVSGVLAPAAASAFIGDLSQSARNQAGSQNLIEAVRLLQEQGLL